MTRHKALWEYQPPLWSRRGWGMHRWVCTCGTKSHWSRLKTDLKSQHDQHRAKAHA